MTRRPPLILSCEHAGNRVPPPWDERFRGYEALLPTHCGWDLGALELAARLRDRFGVPLFTGEVSRLLVDLNRSLGHPTLHADFLGDLTATERQALLDRWYHPYRQAVTAAIDQARTRGRPVLHLSVHSFTPELDGDRRTADIGLLYDPRRPREAAFCRTWQQALRQRQPTLRVRRNYPYRGTADSLVVALRRHFKPTDYLGLELEVSQAFPLTGGDAWPQLQQLLTDTLAGLI